MCTSTGQCGNKRSFRRNKKCNTAITLSVSSLWWFYEKW